mmetsp:Transcript_40000/g.40531  ORF Transcript_40000/g.40531 Transcript_40000/m.40531 type:complete len:346 (-) Transcript_40000:152-1189(-)
MMLRYYHGECLEVNGNGYYYRPDGTNTKSVFDIYLQFLKGEGKDISQHCKWEYDVSREHPSLSLSEATKLASIITTKNQQENITSLAFDEHASIFKETGTFQTIFQGILDNESITSLRVSLFNNTDMDKNGCFGNSTLATNTTLKELEIISFVASIRTRHIDTIKDLADVLRTNQGLEKISIYIDIMTHSTRQYLLDSLRDNSTLLYMNTRANTYRLKLWDGVDLSDTCLLQKQIDQHMKLNRVWKKCNTWVHKRRLSGKRIPIHFYPLLLEKFAAKPMIVFQFLQNENNELCDHYSHDRPVGRRNESAVELSSLSSPLSRLIISLQSVYASSKRYIVKQARRNS